MMALKLDVAHYGGGGPALKAMIAGEAQMMFEPMSASIEPVRSGRLRALGVTTVSVRRRRPEVSAMAQDLATKPAPSPDRSSQGTPTDVVETLNKAVEAAFALL